MKMEPGRADSRLLFIPAELRDQIFGIAIISDEPINLSPSNIHTTNAVDAYLAVKSFRALSLTCTQIHYEIEDLFWKRNSFTLVASRPLPSIPVRHMRNIKNISLCRTLIGTTFLLKIQVQRDGEVYASIEVVRQQIRSIQQCIAKPPQQLEETMIFRLKRGAELTTNMLRPIVENEGGLDIQSLEQSAKMMNEQWLIGL